MTNNKITIAGFYLSEGLKKALLSELEMFRPLVKGKNTIPILNSILLDVSGDRLEMTGTDLNNTLFLKSTVNNTQDGKFCVGFVEFREMLKKARGGCVVEASALETWVQEIEADTKEPYAKRELTEYKVAVTGDNARFETEGSEAGMFPEFAAEGKTVSYISIEAETLKDLIQKTEYAATREQSRFTLAAVMFEFGKTGLRLCTTDGHRMALVDSLDFVQKPSKKESHEIEREIVNLDAARIVSKIASGGVVVYTDKNNFYFSTKHNTRRLIARKPEGRFPTYEMVLPKDNPFVFGFDLAEVSETLKTTLSFVNERTKMVLVQPYYNHLVLKSSETEKQFQTRALCSFEGNGAPGFGVNAQYFLEAVNAARVNSNIAQFSFKDTMHQFEISGSTTLSRYRFVIMPLRPWGENEKRNAAEYQILDETEKEDLKTRPCETIRAGLSVERAARDTSDCFPISEGALESIVKELIFIRSYAGELGVNDSRKAEFHVSINNCLAKLDECQY